jgi:hypothetical protein
MSENNKAGTQSGHNYSDINIKGTEKQANPEFIDSETLEAVSAKHKSEGWQPESGIKFDESGLYDQKVYPLPAELPKEVNYNGEPYYFKHYWPYLDGLGNIVGYVLRYENEDGTDKTIRPAFQKNGNGKWIIKGISKGERRPLYRGELLQRQELRVLIVAGEPCCDLAFRLFGHNFNTITWQGGENSIKQADFQDLKSSDVILFPDNDPAGEQTVKDIIELSKKYQFKSLKIVNWPDELRHIRHPDGAEKNSQYRKWDIVDLYEHYEKDSQKVWEFIMNNAKEPEAEKKDDNLLIGYSDIPLDLEEDWLIEDMLAPDSLTQIFGSYGSGKTFIAIDMICCVLTGKDFHGHKTTKGNVLYIAGEGHKHLKKRFRAWEIKNELTLDNSLQITKKPVGLTNEGEIEFIKAEIEKSNVKPDLIVIDTLGTSQY